MDNLTVLNHRNIIQMPISNGVFPTFKPGLINSACFEAKTITQVSDEMTVLTALITVSTAVQGLIDVELPIGKRASVSIYGLTIANSGERKTAVENIFMKAIREYQKKSLITYRLKLNEYELEKEIYEEKQKKLKKLMVNHKFTEDEKGEYQAEFRHNRKNSPVKPIFPKILYEDSTIEALLFGLYTNIPNGYLGSSEGGVLLNSKSMSDTFKANAIWSGDDISVDRKILDSFTLSDARLVIYIMAQYSAFQEYLNKNKHDTRGSGFWARFLVCAPNTTCGTRIIQCVEQPKEHLILFNERVIHFLEKLNSQTNKCKRKVIQFSNEAKVIWIDIANDIEINMLQGGRYFNAKDHASKLAEIIARVAALLQYFEEPNSTEIETDILWSAINICSFYSGEFLKIFNAPPQYVFDAQLLQGWLDKYKASGIRYVRRNIIMQYGPRTIRKKILLDAALDCLYQSQYLNYLHVGRISVIDLLPAYALDQDKFNADIFAA